MKIARDIECSTCGAVGKIEAHDTKGVVAPENLFRVMGKDRTTGFLRFRCPSCSTDLAVDPMSMLGSGKVLGSGPNRRYVPIIIGLVSIGTGVYLALAIGRWWAFVIAVFCFMFGWPSLKTGLFASKREIAGVTGTGPVSKETIEKFKDRM